MTTAQPLHVIIAGGGLSGLALAQGLLKDGHTCEVFERDADDSRLRPQDAAAAIAPDVTLAPVDDYVMISCSVAPGTVIPPAARPTWLQASGPSKRRCASTWIRSCG